MSVTVLSTSVRFAIANREPRGTICAFAYHGLRQINQDNAESLLFETKPTNCLGFLVTRLYGLGSALDKRHLERPSASGERRKAKGGTKDDWASSNDIQLASTTHACDPWSGVGRGRRIRLTHPQGHMMMSSSLVC